MSEIKAAICKDCRFSHSDSREGPLRCRRFPPIYSGPEPSTTAARFAFPEVKPNQWCGEYAASIVMQGYR